MRSTNPHSTNESGLRILRVVHTLHRKAGGPSESVLRSTEALSALGHHVEIATADPSGTPPPAGAAFPFHPLGGYGPGSLGEWLRSHHQRFDAVLVHGLWQAGWAVRANLQRTSTPYLVFPHGMLDPWFRRAYPIKHVKKQLYWWLREYRVLRDAAVVCFTCDEERRLASQTFTPYRVREQVVSYGTAKPPSNADEQAQALADRFPALSNQSFLLFLGRLHDKKGVRELVTGYARFRRQHPQAPMLVVAGPCADDRLATKLRQLAANEGLTQLDLQTKPTATDSCATLVWLPMLDDKLKWGALQSSEAFILPSHQENFGIAVVEAMACGKPVLISKKVNIWREITNDGAGLAAADTTEGVENLLSQWTALDGKRRLDMGNAARNSFLRRFEITSAAQSLVTAIKAGSPPQNTP